MSESNLSEIVLKAFKKTQLFEKLIKIEFYSGTFMILSSLMGLSCVYIHFFNGKSLHQIQRQIEISENAVIYNMDVQIAKIDSKLSKILENQQFIIHQLDEMKSMKKTEDLMICTTGTSMSSFSPIKIPTNIYDDIRENDYDELMNECYDTIPLNNVKKNTGLSWLFK